MVDLLRSLFLEEPWPLIVAAFALAAVAVIIARAAGKPAYGLTAGLALIATALLAIPLSIVITTDHEQVAQRLDALMAAASNYDRAALDAVATDDLTLLGPSGTPIRQRPGLDIWVQNIAEQYNLRQHRIWTQQTTFPSDGLAITQAEIRTYTENLGAPARTWWELRWTRTPQHGWKISSMTWLRSSAGVPEPGSF
ncbi:MAG: hypothetical protein RIG82_07555 [Phycisphaeraceae bacterium]